MKATNAASSRAAAKSKTRERAKEDDSALQKRTQDGTVTFYSSSEARKHWSKITKQALNGGKIAIIVGKRAVALREVSLTYAEMEYGASESHTDAKAAEIESRAIREIATGQARKIV